MPIFSIGSYQTGCLRRPQIYNPNPLATSDLIFTTSSVSELNRAHSCLVKRPSAKVLILSRFHLFDHQETVSLIQASYFFSIERE